MTKNSQLGALALVVGLALALGACGSQEPASTASGTTANVTFHSEPVAEVWIDGKARGKTPLVIALTAGSHDLALKRRGFHDLAQALTIEGGKDVTVEGTLPVAGSDEAALKRLLAMVGEKHEAFAKPRAHRGASSAVTLYFPSGNVRRKGLGTYRIEVDGSYDYDGFIEFRKGTKVLHREKFEPQTVITEKALPAAVLEAARNGAKLSWGLTFDGKRRKKDARIVKFNVIPRSREKKVTKDLDKLMNRKAMRSATPLMQEMAQIDYLKNRRLYSEVLVRSLGVLNTWESTMMPYRNMVDVMKRLKLKDSSLYNFAAAQVTGGSASRQVGIPVRPTAARTGAAGDPAKARSTPLPPVVVAPRVRTSEAPSGLRPATGVTTSPTTPASGGDAGSSGLADPSDSADSSTGPGAVRVNPTDAMRRALREAELRAANAEEAERTLLELDAALQQATEQADELAQERDEARAALEALEATDPPDPQAIEEARQNLNTAEEATNQAQESLERTREHVTQESEALTRQLEETGPADEARSTADELRRRVTDDAERSGAPDDPVLPGTGPNPPGLPGESDGAQAAHGVALTEELARATDAAAAALDRATEASAAASAATQAVEAAEAAHKAILENTTPPPPEDIEASRLAVEQAASDAARAAMDLERANAELTRAEQNANEARQAVDEHAQQPADGN